MGLDNIVETGVVWEKVKTGVKWAGIGFLAGYISSCTMSCDADASDKIQYDRQYQASHTMVLPYTE